MKSKVIELLNLLLPDFYFSKFNKIVTEITDLVVIKEMGPFKFFLFTILIFIFFLFVLKKNISILDKTEFFKFIKKHYIYFLIIFFYSLFLIELSYLEYKNNPDIFYSPPVGQSLYPKIFYFFIFLITNFSFYLLTNNLIENKKVSLLICLMWMTSALHLSNLYPSLFRDYIRVFLFFICLNSIIFFLKNGINQKNLNYFYFSLFLFCFSLVLKADIKILFPFYILLILFSSNLSLKKKYLLIIITITILFLFIYLTNAVYETRNLQRIGANLGTDLYNFETNFFAGPIEDGLLFYNSCAFYECNNIKSYIYTNFYQIKISIYKYLFFLEEIILSPFKYSLIFESDNTIHKLVYYKSLLLYNVNHLKNLYYILIFLFILKLFLSRNFYQISIILIYCYLGFFYSLENLPRHYFIFESFSLILFFIILSYVYDNSKFYFFKILNFFSKNV